MNLPGEFWAAVGALGAVAAVIVTVARWRRGEPRLSVEAEMHAVFPGYGMIREGSYDTLHPPSPTTRPHQALVTTVKNKSAVDLKFSYAGISLYGRKRSVNLDPKDAADPHNSFQFPVTVPTRDAIKIVMDVGHVQRMLNVLDAQPKDKFRVWVAEPMEATHFSNKLPVSDYMGTPKPLSVTIHHDPQIVVQQIGEEEDNPGGWFPSEPREPADV